MSTIVQQERAVDDNRGCEIRGYLHGLVNPRIGILDPVAGAEIRAVAAEGDGRPRRMTEEEYGEALRGRHILKATADERGRFCLYGDGRDDEDLDVYASIAHIPLPTHHLKSMPLPQREYLYVGRQRPARSERGAYLALTIPQALWCLLKRLADAWTVSGKVSACADDDIAIPGVTVRAFDVDIVQHDPLGSAVTSPAGTYRIDFPGSAYRQGTIIDVELVGGPDLYFSISDSEGNVLVDEPRGKGRSAGRADSRPCAHVDLCVDVPVPDSTTIPTVWTGVGDAFLVSDYDADGYAGPAEYAMTSTLRMRGSAPPKTVGGNPVEYRFRVSDTTAANTAAPLPEGAFTRIVGIGADQALFGATHVGTMVRTSPVFKQVEVHATLDDLDADGWLDVNQSILRAFVDDVDVDPVDIPTFLWDDEDALMAINTVPLTTAPDVPSGAAIAGAAVPAVNHIPIEKKAFRFEVREVVDKPNGVFNTLPGSGQTLNAMVINNNIPFQRLAMTEHQQTTLCSPLTDDIHVAYTVHHPHLAASSISIVSNNNGAYTVSLADPPIPFAGNTNAALTSLNDPAVPVPNSGANVLHRCTYIVTLWVTPRLHNGDSAASAIPTQTSFFYEP